LILSDVDSTLIEQEVIDQLADLAGNGAQAAAITERAMLGELNFENALRERVSLLTGLSESAIAEVAQSLTFTPGATELIEYCSKAGIPFGAVTGGFIQVLDAFGLTLRLAFVRANSLEIVDRHLTGRLLGPIVDRAGKAAALQDFAAANEIPIAETIAIGDGANDLEMVAAAGLGVAFRAKPALRKIADLEINESLAEVIPLL